MEFDNKDNKSKIKTPKVKKRIAVVLLVFLAIITPIIIIVFFFETPGLSDKQETTLSSLKKIDNHPLYIMDYNGVYGFDDYMQSGERVFTYNALEINWVCTCFVTLTNESDNLFGRNFDWRLSPVLVLYTSPPRHYKSISIVDLGLLGVYDDSQLSQNSHDLLRTPYFV